MHFEAKRARIDKLLMICSKWAGCLLVAALSVPAFSQQPQPVAGGQTPQAPPAAGQAPPAAEPAGEQVRPDYTFAAGDQILIRAPGADEINEKPFRIDAEGFLNLPLIGRVKAGGLNITQLEAELVKRLREYIVQPQVFVSVTQFHGAPVFFEGMFLHPTIVTLQGRRTLLEMLAVVGGLQPNAARRIKIRRMAEYGVIPLPGAVQDPEKKYSVVEISMASLRESINPAEDIVLEPYDVVSVDRAELIYVSGEVVKIGGIELGERDSMSITQALALSGGFTKDANRSKARVLRPVLNTNRRAEIDINLNGIYEGKVNDFPLLPNDVLFIPHSNERTILTVAGTIGMATLAPFIYLALK
jgi:polysaccharide biosynthesis/export protein